MTTVETNWSNLLGNLFIRDHLVHLFKPVGSSATLCNMSNQKRRKLSSHAEQHELRKLREDAYLAGMDQFEAMRVAYSFDTTKGFSVRQQLDRLCRFCSLHKWPLYVVRICCDWPFQKRWKTFRKLLADCSAKANVVCEPVRSASS